MTCIVAVVKDGIVYMGGDRFVSDGEWGRGVEGSQKIGAVPAFGRLEFLVGVAGNSRAGQLILNALKMDKEGEYIDRDDPERNVREVFVENARRILSEHGALGKNDDGRDYGATFLVGHMGKLFIVHETFSVQTVTDDYVAIGGGKEYATGALAAIHRTGNAWHPRNRLMVALEVAAKHSIVVEPPFDFMELSK